ncbi:MAG: polysaccharide deacetylase family protein [Candidatus Eremiobacteraeota bacterium]|nr:polysaccharide deacetylase family protein [Candidatus Eremiobacteraeota bacterium]
MRKLRLPLLTLLVAFVAYFGYEIVEAPANQLFGKTIVQGAPSEREVALTFDDGPNPPYTDRILDVLRDERVSATFFVVGRAAAAYPATLRRIVREGHAVGNHTWDHPHLIVESPAAVRSQLLRTDAVIAKITGVHTHLMRPPFGARDFAVIGEAHKLGYRVVMWSVPLPNDWEQPGDATIARRVIDNVVEGSIIVLHDGNRGMLCARDRRLTARDCDRGQDVAATREIVRALRARGYRFVTIPDLVADAQRAAARKVTRTASR